MSILVANPGSSSRKYALYSDSLDEHATLHIETADDKLIGTLRQDDNSEIVEVNFDKLEVVEFYILTKSLI